jgi:hypothetical protein
MHIKTDYPRNCVSCCTEHVEKNKRMHIFPLSYKGKRVFLF